MIGKALYDKLREEAHNRLLESFEEEYERQLAQAKSGLGKTGSTFFDGAKGDKFVLITPFIEDVPVVHNQEEFVKAVNQVTSGSKIVFYEKDQPCVKKKYVVVEDREYYPHVHIECDSLEEARKEYEELEAQSDNMIYLCEVIEQKGGFR